MKDRQKLDSLVLEAIGPDPKRYLNPLYNGICELVWDRVALVWMRKKVKTAKTEKDIEKLMEKVISEVIPDGMRKFPEGRHDFLDPIQAFDRVHHRLFRILDRLRESSLLTPLHQLLKLVGPKRSPRGDEVNRLQ
jgi:hypothetical protein